MIDALPLLLAQDGYQISRSVRLRSSASAYFNRTPASAGNRKTWTWSGWVKRGTLGVYQSLFSAFNGTSNNDGIAFTAADKIELYSAGAAATYRLTTAVYRDPSAHYHIVVASDTPNATAQSRARIWVNGVELTAFDTNAAITQNADWFYNSTNAHNIGRFVTGGYFDGYLAEVNFIDGQALTPASFGETDTITGVWRAKKYTGTYGTNGFYLNFADNSAATAAAIGKDFSGNGNNWTPNNISVTAGSTYDSMLDVPTLWGDGGNGRGNYATLNPLKTYSANFAFSQGNLRVTDSSSNTVTASSSLRTPTSGKWYWEVTAETISAALGMVCASNETVADSNAGGSTSGYYRSGGTIGNLSGVAQTSGASYTSGDVIGVAVDVDAGTVQFYKNNVAQGSTPSFSFTPGTVIVPLVSADNAAGTKTFVVNFGQRPFTYSPPTGFKALNTQNLPDPTIKKGNLYFDATTYLGNGGTQTVSNLSFQPDLVWIKNRSAAANHALLDSVRPSGFALYPNLTDAEANNSSLFTGISGNSFSLAGGNVTYNAANNYISWYWREGATQGFDIVTYTGNGSATQTINHSLGVVPRMIIVKNRSNLAAWPVYHASIGNGNKLVLNATSAQAATGNWASTNPTSAQFYVGGPSSEVNTSSENYVAYLFAEVAGFSRFGSYTGNGSADGPFVFCGFRPRWVMIKQSDAIRGWEIHDTARSTANAMTSILEPNSSAAENTNSAWAIDALSNGFKIRTSDASFNASSGTYIFAAFAENPFRYSLAR